MSTSSTRTADTASTVVAPARAERLMRACECGRAAQGPTGQCASCVTEARLGPASRVTLGAPGDAFEQEADRIADRVVAGGPAAMNVGDGVTRLQRQPVEEEEEMLQARAERLQRQLEDEEEEEEALQMKPGQIRCQEEEEEHLQASGGPGAARTAAAATAASAVASGGHPLSRAERSWFEPRFGADLSHVRLHTDSGAGEAARGIGARAYTLGRHIAFAPGEYAPDSTEGRRLMAHELTHTLQQGGRGPAPLGKVSGMIQRQPNSLGAISEQERRLIRVSTTTVSVPAQRITAFFTLNANGRHGETQSITGTTVVFGTGIATDLQTGLGSIGAWLATSTNALPMNMTIEVALDLSAHGGASRRYRYTRFVHRSGSGRNATRTPVLLVEDLGAATAAPAQTQVPSAVTLGSNSYPLAGSWASDDYAELHQALSLLPAAARTAANGLTFRRRSGNAGGTEAGHYDPASDTVELFDDSFPTTSVRLGGQSLAVRNIVHEIGHALDLRPLEAAWTAFDAAGQSASARRTLLDVRSPSGTRWVRESGGDYGQDMNAADRSPAFRQAVRRDGVRLDSSGRTTPEGTTATLSGGVTTYSDTDYQELYAESFMLYVNAPDMLRSLRPATFDFFQANYPRSSP